MRSASSFNQDMRYFPALEVTSPADAREKFLGGQRVIRQHFWRQTLALLFFYLLLYCLNFFTSSEQEL
jgi:hypothetical protein